MTGLLERAHHYRHVVLRGAGVVTALALTLTPSIAAKAEAPLQALPAVTSGSNETGPAATAEVGSIEATTTAYNPAVVGQNRRIELSIEARRVSLYQGDMLVSSYPVAVGTAETPTPQGEFTVSKMVVNPVWQSPWTGEVHEPGPDSALGLRWIEFATSEAGAFGFHGTPTLDSIGHAASNGCVRMRNEDVVALFAQVEVGTPVVITQ